jgi:hypothetical protein
MEPIMHTEFIILLKYLNWLDRVIFQLSRKIRGGVDMLQPLLPTTLPIDCDEESKEVNSRYDF